VSGQERTEEATPKRRLTARTAGHLPRSMLAPAAVAILAAPLVVTVVWQWVVMWPATWTAALDELPAVPGSGADLRALLHRAWIAPAASRVEHACWLLWLIALGVGVAGAAASGALRPAPGALRPRLERLARGWRALVTADQATHVALAGACCVFLGWLAAPVIVAGVRAAAVASPDLGAVLAAVTDAAKAFWVRAAGGICGLALLEVMLARRRYAVQLRMTPREVREERAETETRPEIKSRRRAAASRHARDLRVAAIRRATAVLVNPRHVAVALRYAPPALDVPRVVARGAELSALLVRAVAARYDVPVIEAPELARLLYATTSVDDPIPETCYAAVAAIFAWIVRTGGRLRRGDEDEV
jgi:flagellar biosynthetic protein FlhB